MYLYASACLCLHIPMCKAFRCVFKLYVCMHLCFIVGALCTQIVFCWRSICVYICMKISSYMYTFIVWREIHIYSVTSECLYVFVFMTNVCMYTHSMWLWMSVLNVNMYMFHNVGYKCVHKISEYVSLCLVYSYVILCLVYSYVSLCLCTQIITNPWLSKSHPYWHGWMWHVRKPQAPARDPGLAKPTTRHTVHRQIFVVKSFVPDSLCL